MTHLLFVVSGGMQTFCDSSWRVELVSKPTACGIVAISTHEAGQEVRETPVEQRQEKRRAKRRNPTGLRVLRDSWLSPLE